LLYQQKLKNKKSRKNNPQIIEQDLGQIRTFPSPENKIIF